MKSFSKALAIMWFISAGLNLLTWAICDFEFDKLLICLLECIIAQFNWKDYKRGE
jgi:hypothetical protein